MLKKENRLTKKKDFDRIFANGRSSYDKTLGVKITANDISQVRVGFLVGSKISKKAIIRNLIKRRLRAAISSFLFSLPTGFDIVIIASPSIKEKTYQEIEKSLTFNIKKLFKQK